MHQVFSINELLCMVLSYLGDDLPTLASAARVCKNWHESAVEVLWSTVDTLDFLPDDPSRDEEDLDVREARTHVLRLSGCMRHIKELKLFRLPIHKIIDEHSFEFLAKKIQCYRKKLDRVFRHNLPSSPDQLVPALTSLSIAGFPMEIVAPVTRLCGEHVISLRAVDIPPFTAGWMNKPHLDLTPLARRTAGLRTLYITIHQYPVDYFSPDPEDSPEVVDQIVGRQDAAEEARLVIYRKYTPLFLSFLSCGAGSILENVRLPTGEKDTTTALAYLPRLRVLHLDIWSAADDTEELPPDPPTFPSLEKLTATIMCDIEDGIVILRRARCLPRTEVHLDLRSLIFDDCLPQLVGTLLDPTVNPSLRRFTIESRNSVDYGPTGFSTNLETLRSLLAFRKLEEVKVDFGLATALTNDDLARLVEAWPCIRRLSLGSMGVVFEAAPDLLGLRALARCEHLEHVEMLVDASLPEDPGDIHDLWVAVSALRSHACPLRVFVPEDSTIRLRSHGDVAQIFASLFPQLRTVQAISTYPSAEREWKLVARTINSFYAG